MRKTLFFVMILLVSFVFAEDRISVKGFQLGSADLTAAYEAKLLKALKNVDKGKTLEIKGVADHVKWKKGSTKSQDEALARKRAKNVAIFLANEGYKVKIAGIIDYDNMPYRGVEILVPSSKLKKTSKSAPPLRNLTIYTGNEGFSLSLGFETWIPADDKVSAMNLVTTGFRLHRNKQQTLILGVGFYPEYTIKIPYQNRPGTKKEKAINMAAFSEFKIKPMKGDSFNMKFGCLVMRQSLSGNLTWTQTAISPFVGFGFDLHFVDVTAKYSPAWVNHLTGEEFVNGFSLSLDLLWKEAR